MSKQHLISAGRVSNLNVERAVIRCSKSLVGVYSRHHILLMTGVGKGNIFPLVNESSNCISCRRDAGIEIEI